MVQADLYVYKIGPNFMSHLPSFHIVLTGWRVDCKRKDIPFELLRANLIYLDKLEEFMVKLVITDAVLNTSITTYIFKNTLIVSEQFHNDFLVNNVGLYHMAKEGIYEFNIRP
ncbi:hypothetical protein RF11_01937 [Thelohanellus kitauei]|uniref:Uncharacterized protein n=1 Tax=Thelohanellus kitauei TaxID=669202 RepID=A0A0C2MIM6_THEKT|nr:hypothetical protein RF11_01937 [Thelohanellus kitauei]